MANRFIGGILSSKQPQSGGFVSRASTGTYFDNTGTLVTAPINQPRLNYSFNGSPASNRYSALFTSASTNYLSAVTAASAVGTGNFTMEFWWRANSTTQTNYANVINQGFTGSPSNGAFAFKVYAGTGSSVLNFTYYNGGISDNATSVNVNDLAWHHIAASRNGTSLGIYVDGVNALTITLPASFNMGASGGTTYIGYNPRDVSYINGYVKDVRIITGQALYSGTFTPPTAPLTTTTVGSTGAGAAATLSGTVLLLTCSNSGLSDSSSNNYTITNTNAVTSSTLLPNQLGIDTSGTGWSSPTVLIEQSVTNGQPRSQNFTVSPWNTEFTTVTNNNGVAPDGTSTAATFIPTAVNNYHRTAIGWGSITGQSNGVWTTSMFVKAYGYSYVSLRFDDGITIFATTFNLSGVGATSTGYYDTNTAAANPLSNSITPVGNGWYRIAVTTRVISSASLGLYFHVLSNATTSSFTADGTSGVYIWGAQVEKSYGATSYIPTNGSAVARAQDDVGPLGSGVYTLSNLQTQTAIDDQYIVNTYTLPYYGGYFNGSTSYLSIAQTTSTDLAANNFTLEMWIYFGNTVSNSSVNNNICGKWNSSSQWILQFRAAGADSITNQHWRFYTNNGSGPSTDFQETSTTSVQINTWYHIALVRNGSSFIFYRNGGQVGSTLTSAASIPTSSDTLTIGSAQNNSSSLIGYISNFRLVIGTAVYTSAFTVPTGPLTAITNTILLTLQSSTIFDASSNNFTITNNNVTPSTINVFGSTQYWTAPQDVTSIETLVVAGGGGGTISGGGAGGVIYNASYPVTPGQTYPITIGQGGTGCWSSGTVSQQGGNTSFSNLIAIGGGATTRDQSSGNSSGGFGGSGGGGSLNSTSSGTTYAGSPGVAGQGYPGGSAVYWGTDLIGGGGGGSGGPGGPLGTSIADNVGAIPNGGPGSYYNISGSLIAYAGGGGGGTRGIFTTAGTGGVGGGGTGYFIGTTPGANATGYGSGGGGGLGGGSGSSGIVITKYKRTNRQLSVTSNAAVVTQKFTTTISAGWTAPAGVTQVEVLVVAGGGGGGYGTSGRTGGGGAGGVVYNSAYSVTPGSSYTVTIGSGGTGSTTNAQLASVSNGSNSVFGTLTALGGGGGANGSIDTSANVVGASGGSGGGGGGSATISNTYSGGSASQPGSGSGGYGNAGGNGIHLYGTWAGGGAGGGAGSVGYSANNISGTFSAPAGGTGLPFTITGNAEFYAGGGGGSFYSGTSYGPGGAGGGGVGNSTGAGFPGATNTGGGGGAGGNGAGGSGGSGVVIIRYRVPTVATFLDSGAWTCPAGVTSVQALVVAGGGGASGSGTGGGGAGGVVYSSSVAVTPGITYSVVVGQGGVCTAAGVQASNGQNSSFTNLIAIGGGAGGYRALGQTGGSGGGGSSWSGAAFAGGSSTYGQGNGGGAGNGTIYYSGGGGGAGGTGGNAVSGSVIGTGGNGLAFNISGTSTYYGGGGGAGGQNVSGTIVGAVGGLGGGGAGSQANGVQGTSGTQNTGGGSGSGWAGTNDTIGGNGGSGIVIIRYYGG